MNDLVYTVTQCIVGLKTSYEIYLRTDMPAVKSESTGIKDEDIIAPARVEPVIPDLTARVEPMRIYCHIFKSYTMNQYWLFMFTSMHTIYTVIRNENITKKS